MERPSRQVVPLRQQLVGVADVEVVVGTFRPAQPLSFLHHSGEVWLAGERPLFPCTSPGIPECI